MDLVGVDYFGHVTVVGLCFSSRVSAATIEQVGRLTRVQSLNLYKSSASDLELAHFTGLTNLSYLMLGDTQVTDTGLAQLKRLSKLSSLDLSSTQVTDSGLVHLDGAEQSILPRPP